jgi:glycine/D-amino acid oxidase-like deaminating enzyme
MEKAEVVICGAGIAGVSAAYSLAVEQNISNVVLVDENPPLSQTSDHSTECYRNWWPGPDDAMVAFMNRSIDRLEMLARQSGNIFHLNRRGYLYCTARADKARELEQSASEISALGAGPLRVYKNGANASAYSPLQAEGFENQPIGADLLLSPALIRSHFPYVSDQIIAALHVRRAGWFSAQQLGMYLLQQARQHGVRLIHAKVAGVSLAAGRVNTVHLANGAEIKTSVFVNAAGPRQAQVAQLLGVDLPVYNELHLKAAFKDTLGILDRSAPLVILSDTQRLNWSDEERSWLAEDDEYHYLLDELPPGLHTRPEGGADSPIILVLWEYHTRRVEPILPIPEDPLYPDVLLRGLPRLIPGMSSYLHKVSRPRVDGGYYTRTRENRPLICPLPVAGAYLIGALSGFGLMAACAAGELLARHVVGAQLPHYAPSFSLERYQDAAYLSHLDSWYASGQL